jgi:hypothetical protein
MKAEKAANIALENDELTETLGQTDTESSHKYAYRVCEIPKALSNSIISLFPMCEMRKQANPTREGLFLSEILCFREQHILQQGNQPQPNR